MIGMGTWGMTLLGSELEMPLPIGLVYDGAGRVVLDPDRQVQDTVRLLFEMFNDLGSACAVHILEKAAV